MNACPAVLAQLAYRIVESMTRGSAQPRKKILGKPAVFKPLLRFGAVGPSGHRHPSLRSLLTKKESAPPPSRATFRAISVPVERDGEVVAVRVDPARPLHARARRLSRDRATPMAGCG